MIDATALANEIWDGIKADVRDSLSAADQTKLKEAAAVVARYHVQNLLGKMTAADHNAVKAILANTKSAVGAFGMAALKASFERIVKRGLAMVLAL